MCYRAIDYHWWNEQNELFLGHFWPLKQVILLEVAGAAEKIALSLKTKHEIKLSLSKSLIHRVQYNNLQRRYVRSIL